MICKNIFAGIGMAVCLFILLCFLIDIFDNSPDKSKSKALKNEENIDFQYVTQGQDLLINEEAESSLNNKSFFSEISTGCQIVQSEIESIYNDEVSSETESVVHGKDIEKFEEGLLVEQVSRMGMEICTTKVDEHSNSIRESNVHNNSRKKDNTLMESLTHEKNIKEVINSKNNFCGSSVNDIVKSSLINCVIREKIRNTTINYDSEEEIDSSSYNSETEPMHTYYAREPLKSYPNYVKRNNSFFEGLTINNKFHKGDDMSRNKRNSFHRYNSRSNN